MAILLYESVNRDIGVTLDRLARDYALAYPSQVLIIGVKDSFPKIEELVGKYNGQDGFSIEGFANEVLGHLRFMGLSPEYIDSVCGISAGHKEFLDIIGTETFFIKVLQTKPEDREEYSNSLIGLHGKVKDKDKLEKILENSRNYTGKIDVLNRYFSFVSGLEDRYFNDVERTIKLVNCAVPNSKWNPNGYKLIGYIDQNPDLFGSFEDTLSAFRRIVDKSDIDKSNIDESNISKLVQMLPDMQAIIASLKKNNLSLEILPKEVKALHNLDSDKRLNVIRYIHENIRGETREERDENLKRLIGIYAFDELVEFIDKYSRDKNARLGKNDGKVSYTIDNIHFFEPMLDDERLISDIMGKFSKDKNWKSKMEDLNRAVRSTKKYIIRMYQAPFAFPQYWESLTQDEQKRALRIIMGLDERSPLSDSWLEKTCGKLIESMGILGVGKK